MAGPFYDRVLQTTLAGGNGPLVIGNTRVVSYRLLTEVAEILNGDQWFYCIEDETIHAFEIGKGFYDIATDTLQRSTCLLSSSANQFVNFAVGTVKRVFSVAPEQYVNWLHQHIVDNYTLDAGDLAVKYITTTHVPLAASVRMVIAGAPGQIIGVGYTVDLQAQRVTWDGLTLDGLLRAGDKVSVEYVRGVA